MPETITQPNQTQVQTQTPTQGTSASPSIQTTSVQSEPQVQTADQILSRMKPPSTSSSDLSLDDLKVNPNDLDQIKDPIARKMVEDRYKAWESGFNKKFQQVAEMKRQLESQALQSSTWTPERLRQEISRQDFVTAAQALQREAAPQTWEGSQEEWSALSTEDKARFEELNQKVNNTQAQLNTMLRSQEDSSLKTRYPDYDPRIVDHIQTEFYSGRVKPSREDFWKVINFENAVQAAYRLGIEDRNSGLSEKLNAGQPLSGMNVKSANEVPDEIRKKGFGAIGRWRLDQMAAKK